MAKARADAFAAQSGPHPVNHFAIEVSLYGAYPQASFRVMGLRASAERMFSAIPTDIVLLQSWKSEEAGDDSDLATVNRFTGRAVFALGELIGAPE